MIAGIKDIRSYRNEFRLSRYEEKSKTIAITTTFLDIESGRKIDTEMSDLCSGYAPFPFLPKNFYQHRLQ